MIYYNPLDKFYKNITGAICCDDKLKIRVKGSFGSVFLIIKKDGDNEYKYYKMQKIADCFEVVLSLNVGLYFYCFKADDNFISITKDYLGEISKHQKDFQLSVFSKDFIVPKNYYNKIIYQIFPDRFCNGTGLKDVGPNKVFHQNWNDLPQFLPDKNGKILNNDFFGGDFKGIISKIPYLKELGVDVIYLNPIFKAYSNHRYDTGDYMQIDPVLGTEDDFVELLNVCRQNGIEIILDGVFNHTGSDSIYFNKYSNYESLGAYQSECSPYYKWYNFINYPNEYESWWGIDTLPSINESNEEFVNFITGENGVIDKYTKLGVCGWRLDVVDELPAEFVKKIRTAVKKVNSNAILIGEVWEDASNKISYSKRREYFLGEELDSVMNYPLKNAILDFVKNKDSESLSYTVKTLMDHYPHSVLNALMNILSTHDTVRLISSLYNVDYTKKDKEFLSKFKITSDELIRVKFLQKVASLLQFTLFGLPTIYYGDEIGMQGYSDPLNRCTFSWDKIDNEVIDWYKFLCKFRKENKVFSDGGLKELFTEKGVYIFKRFNDNQEIIIAVNLSENDISFEFCGEVLEQINNRVYKDEFVLSGNDFAILMAK